MMVIVAITCDPLDDPDNGNVVQSSEAVVGSRATYSCIDGFTLVGVSVRACMTNGEYSGKAPTCQGRHYHTHTHSHTDSHQYIGTL